MKRILSLVLSLALLLGSIPMVISAAAPDGFQTNFAINKLDGKWNTATDGTGQACDTVQVDYQLKGIGLSGVQGAWIAVDLNKLAWVHNTANGYTVFDVVNVEPGASSVKFDNSRFYKLKASVEDDLLGTVLDSWKFSQSVPYVALSADNETLYISLSPTQESDTPVTYTELTTIVSLRFAVLPGAELETDSIRYITPEERNSLNQSYIFCMNDGISDGYYYGSIEGGKDTLSVISFTGDAGITGLPTVHAATPVITQPPASADYYLDAVAAPLSVVATVSDGGTLSYKWYKKAANDSDADELVSTLDTCPINTDAISDAYYYVVVTNTNNAVNGNKTASVTTDAVHVTVSKDPDTIALENAKAIIDAAAAIAVSQESCPTEESVRNYIHTELSKLVSDVELTVNKVTYTASVPGTSANPTGTAGSYTYTVTIEKNGKTADSKQRTSPVAAVWYDGVTDEQAAQLAKEKLLSAIWESLLQKNAETKADAIAALTQQATTIVGNAAATVVVSVADSGFLPAVAGSADTSNAGTPGSVAFDVTVAVGAHSHTVSDLKVDIIATEYDGQLYKDALANAEEALNGISWADIAQDDANTKEAVIAYIKAKAEAAIAKKNENVNKPADVTVTVDVSNFDAAKPGSAATSNAGDKGSVEFTVTATVAGKDYTITDSFNIIADTYDGQLNVDALAKAETALNGIAWDDIAQTVANTKEDVVAYIKAIAEAAIADANKETVKPVKVDVTVTVGENGFKEAVAGSASVGANGIAGSVAFTVTATVAGETCTITNSFNIIADTYDGQLNVDALAKAETALNGITWDDIAQETANTEAAVIAYIKAIAEAAIADANKETVKPVKVDVTVTVGEGNFTAAEAGSSSTSREGTTGSVKFTVTATVAGETYTTAEKTFDIIATYYDGVMDEDAVDAGKKALDNLTETTVTVKIGATAAEILDYVTEHLQSFMKGDATGVTVSVAAGSDGQYTVTLTKGKETVETNITLTVEEEDPIKLEAPADMAFVDGVAYWNAIDHAVSYTVNVYLVSGESMEIIKTETTTAPCFNFSEYLIEGASYVFDVTVHGDGIYYVDSDASVHSGVYTVNTALTPEQAMLILMMLKSTRADITATAGEGGSISDDGVKTVRRGNDITYRITATEGYEIDTVIVDGQAIGAVSEYTFKNVQKDHTIVAVFKPAKWQNPFTDVNELHSYYDAVRFVYERGLFEGVSKTEFAPTVSMTRAMFVTVLWRLEGMPVVNYAMQFSDVEENTWYTDAIRWAAAQGIVEGYGDGIYGTNDPVTVEQAAVIMARYAQYAGTYTAGHTDLSAFADHADVADWAAEAVQWSVAHGIYLGEAGKLLPTMEAPRSLAAEWMYEYTVRFGK